jgi:hypothetical protein
MPQDFEIAPQELWREKHTYDEAVLYCMFLEHNGRGWRLPHSYGWLDNNNRVRLKHDDLHNEKDEDTYVNDEEDTLVGFMQDWPDPCQFWVDNDHSSIFRNDQYTTIPVRSTNGN